MTTWTVIIERGPTSWGAYAPALPGLGVAGETRAEAVQLIRERSRSTWRVCKPKGFPSQTPRASKRSRCRSEVSPLSQGPTMAQSPGKTLRPTARNPSTVASLSMSHQSAMASARARPATGPIFDTLATNTPSSTRHFSPQAPGSDEDRNEK